MRHRWMTRMSVGMLVAVLSAVASHLQAADAKADAQTLLAKVEFTGGLAVLLGSRETGLLETLGREPGSLVQVLDPVDARVAAARKRLLKANLYGKVTAKVWTGDRLPYADNLVRLLVVQQPDLVAREEAMRVLCPKGILAWREPGGGWAVEVKPWPDGMDSWTHFLHGPDNNAVAQDRLVGPPRQLQWSGNLALSRDHVFTPSLTSLVSDAGRLFAIMDYGPTVSSALPYDWHLVARDAFSGVELWRVAVGRKWATHGFRGGPASFARRLVAAGGRVYVTLGDDAPVSQLNAATGKALRTFSSTEGAQEILVDDRLLAIKRGNAVMMLDTESGETIWEKQIAVASMSLTLSDGICCAIDGRKRQLVAWDARDGQERWRHGSPPGAVVVVRDGVVLFGTDSSDKTAGKTKGTPELIALDATTGSDLWKAPFGTGFQTSADLLVVNGVVWTSEEPQVQNWSHSGTQFTQGRDLKTGTVVKTLDTRKVFDLNLGVPHHRCYRNKATQNFLIAGRDGTDFIDVRTGAVRVHRWTRGTCRYGILPANGLLYVPPHACHCYPNVKLNGFLAFTPTPPNSPVDDSERLRKGPAYRTTSAPHVAEKHSSGWPTFRGDAERSGRSRGAVSARLEPAWTVKLGGGLTQPVCMDGRVLVARKETGQIVCLTPDTGKEVWRFTADAMVDSPPTCFGDGVLFGCRDGRIHRLRAEDGALEWTFLAAPSERWVCSHDRVESAWPIFSSVLVVEGKVLAVAGHNSFLADGLYYYQLDAVSGRMIYHTAISDQDPLQGLDGDRRKLEGALNDILSSDGKSWFLRHRRFSWDGTAEEKSSAHLFATNGFLDPSLHHRYFWIYSDRYRAIGGKSACPYGRIMSVDEHTIFGFRTPVHLFGRRRGTPHTGQAGVLYAMPRPGAGGQDKPSWNTPSPLYVTAMALTPSVLFVAGRKGNIEESLDAFRGNHGSALQAVSPETGTRLAEYQLERPPVFDGLIAAEGSVYLTDAGGSVICWKSRP